MKTLAADLVEDLLHTRLAVVVLGLFLLHLLLAPAAGAASLGHQARGIAAVGLWISTLVGLVGAVFIGIRAVGGALADGTAELALVRPISRAQWVLGRSLGAGVAVVVWTTAVLGAWLPIAAWYGWLVPATGAVWVAMCAQLALVAAWSLFLSALARPAVAAMGAGALVFAGVFADEVLRYTSEAGPVPRVTAQLLYAVVPDLDLLDLHGTLVHGTAVDVTALAWAVTYAATASAALVLLTARVVRDRDIRSPS